MVIVTVMTITIQMAMQASNIHVDTIIIFFNNAYPDRFALSMIRNIPAVDVGALWLDPECGNPNTEWLPTGPSWWTRDHHPYMSHQGHATSLPP